jgi:hypothetical protein
MPTSTHFENVVYVFGKALGLENGRRTRVRANEQHEPTADAATAAERLVEVPPARAFHDGAAVIGDTELRQPLDKAPLKRCKPRDDRNREIANALGHSAPCPHRLRDEIRDPDDASDYWATLRGVTVEEFLPGTAADGEIELSKPDAVDLHVSRYLE